MSTFALEREAGRSATQSQLMSAYTASFGLSLGLTNLFNALLVVVKETNEHTVLAWMKALGHHWVVHGILDVAVFVALGFLLVPLAESWRVHPPRICGVAIGGVVIGALIIATFYLRELL